MQQLEEENLALFEQTKSNVQRQGEADAKSAELLETFDDVCTIGMTLARCISRLIGMCEMEQDPSRRDQSLGLASGRKLTTDQTGLTCWCCSIITHSRLNGSVHGSDLIQVVYSSRRGIWSSASLSA